MRIEFSSLFYQAREAGLRIQDPLSRIFKVSDKSKQISETLNVPVDKETAHRDRFLKYKVENVTDFMSGEVVGEIEKKTSQKLSPELKHFTKVY